ncbi:MAG TPA: rhodanese-like domain-containing protein, partial [Candidatus Limnocylindria bacterium]
MGQNCAVLPEDVSKQRSVLHLLDVREQDEWDAGHIEGSQHIPLGEL